MPIWVIAVLSAIGIWCVFVFGYCMGVRDAHEKARQLQAWLDEANLTIGHLCRDGERRTRALLERGIIDA